MNKMNLLGENNRTGISRAVKTPLLILALLFPGLFFQSSLDLCSQSIGYKFFENYSYKKYDHHPQNWGMAQAENGLIYVANQGGVLEYDGVSWRVIGVPDYDTVRSLDIAENGTVYIGGNNKIGCLVPNSLGSLEYRSLLDPEDNIKKFGYVWSTHATRAGIYFKSSKFLFRWDGREMKTITTDDIFKASFVYKGELVVQEGKRGLLKVVEDSLQPMMEGEKFAGERIYIIGPYDNMSILIGTGTGKFFLYDGIKTTLLNTEPGLENYLKKNRLSHGIPLSSGDFALATLDGGTVTMDPAGHLKDTFDKGYGLQDENVKYVFQDKQGNLWFCLNKGISKIEYTSPISIYGERCELHGIVLSVAKHQNDLYAGTINGLFKLEIPLKFRLIQKSDFCWSLLSTGDSLLAATARGIFQVGDISNQKITEEHSYALLPSRYHPGRVWCGTKSGLVVLINQNGKWQIEQRFETDKQSIYSIAEDKEGNIWLGTLAGIVFKINSPIPFSKSKTTRYSSNNKLPDGEIYVTFAAGHMMFATRDGLFYFDEHSQTFIADHTLGDKFKGGFKPVFRLVEDNEMNIWFHTEGRNYLAVPDSGNSFTIRVEPFLRMPINQVNAFYPDPDGKITWFATVEGLIRYDRTVEKNYSQYFQTLVREVIANENQEYERPVFGGCKGNKNKTDKAPLQTFEYRERNLYFEFAAPFFEAENETRYRYIMQGYDEHWSRWSTDTRKNYTNLGPGDYSFRVQAKNVFGHIGHEDIYSFKIKPPWYMTWWAFTLYGLTLLVLMFFVVRWRSHKLERDKQKLEYTIKERTKEIREKNVQLSQQSEKLKEMDKVKSRFFANISHEFRTPLTLIMSPLEQMLSHSRDKQQKKQYNVMLRNSQRLLTLINQLLDLSRFDSGKMQLHAVCQNIVPFLKGTLGSFHMLVQQNQLDMEFRPEEKDISLYFDPQRMEEVMYNLLINAVKFTPPGGRIVVSVAREQRQAEEDKWGPGGCVKISVQDTGTGISQEQMEHIFDRFHQADNLNKKNLKGTGIGLALTKEIVLLHHGTINVHSQEGIGTEFVIRMAPGHEHLEPNQIVLRSEVEPEGKKSKEIERLYVNTDENAVEEENDFEIPGDTEAVNGKTEGNGKQEKNVILVVEDNADVRQYIMSPLISSNYDVKEAVDGKQGIQKAKEIIPDLIVSDIMMPEADGYELCRVLKKDINTSHIPIILLTAKASEKSIVRGLETGADDYVTKPFNTQILLIRIKNLIDLRQQMQLKIQRQKMLLPGEISVSSMDEQFLKEFQGIIEKNLSNPELNIETLCQKLYMGRTTLFRKVEALTGETPKQFIVSYRLERAAQLLRDNFGNITEVAMEVGFSNPQYFSQCFKEKFHMTPRSFKASESG